MLSVLKTQSGNGEHTWMVRDMFKKEFTILVSLLLNLRPDDSQYYIGVSRNKLVYSVGCRSKERKS